MPFKFFNTGLLFSTVLALIVAPTTYAQLDWDEDVVVFGTDGIEYGPSITSIGNSQFRAICSSGIQSVLTRRSQIGGEAWGVSDELMFDIEVYDHFRAVSDNQYAYMWDEAGGIWRIPHTQTEWPDDDPVMVFPNSTFMYDLNFVSDAPVEPVDSYLHGVAVYQDNLGEVHFSYCRSADHAGTFSSYGEIDSAFLYNGPSITVAAAYTWTGNDERLWAAITLDRPGTIGEQVTLYYSDDLGQSWSSRFTPDSSSYEQLSPSIVGFGETIMVAYERRNSASVAHDVYFIYSPDNGESWSEPIQLTDHTFDDTKPELELSGNTVGLFYSRAQVQAAAGQLLFRQTSLDQPWAWELETIVSEPDAFMVAEGYSGTSNENGFAAVWSGRLVGDDGDIFFDASWRGLTVNERRRSAPSRARLSQNPLTGRIEYELPRGTQITATLFDMLGRTVNQTTLVGSNGVWNTPSFLPSGTYILSAQSSLPLKIQIAR